MSIQIKKKFIKSQVIDGTKVLFLNDDSFKALNSQGQETALFKLDAFDKLQILQLPQVSSDPIVEADLTRKGYVDTSVAAEQARAIAAEGALTDAINNEAAARSSADFQLEMDIGGTRSSAGLETDGSYVAPTVSNYLSSATTLKEADSLLDSAVKAEADAREAEDLTLLKLDGSRAMEGNLSMGSVGGDFVDSAQFIDSVVNPGQRALSLTFTSPLPSSGIYVAVPVGGDVEALITASGPIDYEYGPAFSGDTAKVFENAFPTQPEKDWYFLPDLTGGGSFDYANKIALVTADFSLESVTSLGSGGGNSYKITNLADGVDAGDAVNKGQLDAVAASLGGDIQAALAAEIAAREAADVALQSEVDAVEAALAQEILDRVADVDAEETRALAAEGILQSNIDVEKGRIDAILLASDADKDSFAEIVALINSVDTENDSAFAAYVLSNDAALAQEVSDRISDVNAEETRALAAEGVLQDNIDAEETRALAAEGVLQGNIDTEEAARIAADSALQGELDATQVGAGLGTDGSYTAPAVSNYLGSAVSLKDADSKLDTEIKSVADDLAQEILDRVADVDAEETRALAAEGLLDGRLDILEGDATTEGSVAKAEQDAKDYTDAAIAQEVLDRNAAISTAVSNLVDGAPALLDTLNELAAAINDDENFAATIATQIGGLDSRTDALEAASIEFKAVEKFVLTSTNISNGYVDISYQAIQNSLRVSVDRLAIHQGASNDYTVSVVGGVTRITFVNSLVTPGQEQISVGDEVYVEGAKLAIVTV